MKSSDVQCHCTRAATFLWLFYLFLPAATHAQVGCGVAGGNSPCTDVRDITVVDDRSGPLSHVGNGVNVITANQYRVDTDFIDSSTPLSLLRHYNSQNAAYNQGLGLGWHMSYLAYLDSIGNHQIVLIQGDGRRIHFLRTSTENLFRAPAAADGYIRQSGQTFQWHQPRGAILRFHGPLLTSINTEDSRTVHLRYGKGGLKSVQDDSGRRIEFNYRPDGTGTLLLRDIRLPDDSHLQFRYTDAQLTQVLRNGVLQLQYHYESENGAGLLTGVTNAEGIRLNHTSYDSAGRPETVENLLQQRSIRYRYEQQSATTGKTQVISSDGATGTFNWRYFPTEQRYQLLETSVESCADCPAQQRTYQYDALHRQINNAPAQSGSSLLAYREPVRADPSTLQMRRSIFGGLASVQLGITAVSMANSDADREAFNHRTNARAARAVFDELHRYRRASGAEQCAELAVDAEQEQTLEEQIDNVLENSEPPACDTEANPVANSTPGISGAIFRDIRAGNCTSYFDTFFGTRRGFQIEDAMAEHADFTAAQVTSSRFPVVDFLIGREAIAIASRDLRSQSYANPLALYRRLMSDAAAMDEKFLRQLRDTGFVQAVEGGILTTIRDTDVDLLVFELIIQQDSATASQQAQIRTAATDMLTQFGIELRVVEIP